MNHPPRRVTYEKIYVKVHADFDATGYMQPRSIIWADGRIFPIESVKDYRPADSVSGRKTGAFGDSDCYTVVIQGHDKHLFFERASSRFHSLVGRWYVENVE